MEIDKTLAILSVILMLCIGVVLGFALDDPKNVEVEKIVYQDKIEIVEVPIQNVSGCSSEGIYSLTKSEYEDSVDEAKALELANSAIDSRDLKKAIYDALVDYGVSIENYKDVKEYDVKDVDVDGNTVTYDLKVKYVVDGDSDEVEKARLNEFTIEVNYLDFDDNYEDTEVNEDYLDSISVKKIYN